MREHRPDGHTTALRPLQIAVAQPPCVTGDVAANLAAHALAVLAARARLVVFPELSLTGYDLEAAVVSVDPDTFAPLIDACRILGSMALVGAPVAVEGVRAIAVLQVDAHGVRVAYRKQHLGADETRHFTAGPELSVLDVDGWRVGLGVCRDTGVAEHVQALAAAGIDLYAAGLVDHPADLAVQRERAGRIARACDAPVAFASFAGATGSGYQETAGRSAIYARDGSLLQETSELPSGIARALLP